MKSQGIECDLETFYDDRQYTDLGTFLEALVVLENFSKFRHKESLYEVIVKIAVGNFTPNEEVSKGLNYNQNDDTDTNDSKSSIEE